MNKLFAFYYSLPHDSKFGIMSKIVNRVLARLFKRYLDRTVPKSFKKKPFKDIGINTTEKREKKYIVSLTSFPARIDDVWICVETILRQSFKPDAIILWLSQDQFNEVTLPQNLTNLVERGLTIRFVSGDIRSHKKYKYALEEFPHDYIITLDDDLYYDEGLIQNLVELKEQFPNCIPTNRVHKMTFRNNSIQPYGRWFHNAFDNNPSHNLVQTGGYGTLYFSTDLYKEYNDEEVFLKFAPFADDLWLKIMVLLQGKKVVTNSKYNKDPLSVKRSQNNKLVTQNVLGGGNDSQFKSLLKHFDLSTKNFQDET
jgi:hypothetical protein